MQHIKALFAYLKKRFFYLWLLIFAGASVLLAPDVITSVGWIATFLYFVLISRFNLKGFIIGMLPLLGMCLYYPISLRYGQLNSGSIAAFFETNLNESLAFLDNVKLVDYLFPLLYFLLFYFTCRLVQNEHKKTHQEEQRKQKLLNFVVIGAFLFSVFKLPVSYYLEHKDDSLSNLAVYPAWSLSNNFVPMVRFYVNTYDAVNDYFKEKKALEDSKNAPSPFYIKKATPQYKNYVLVIGESARKDYLHHYGFPLETSPFFDKTNGVIFNNYISAAPATYHSLLYTLYDANKINQSLDYSYNIINLAKSAGFETYWFSNQGAIGRHDTLSSRLAMMSHHHQFTHKADYSSAKVSDLKLLDYLTNALKEESDKPRLFILHLMGSHGNFCHRVEEDERPFEYINKSLSCYVNSILKTDKLLEKTVSLLKETNESFSMIYFSDHGLGHSHNVKEAERLQSNFSQVTPFSLLTEKAQKDLSLEHTQHFKESYQVPFLKVSSDDKERREFNAPRTAFHFLQGFAEWLHIQTPDLDQNYHFWLDQADEEIKVYNMKEMVSFDDLKSDPLLKNSF